MPGRQRIFLILFLLPLSLVYSDILHINGQPYSVFNYTIENGLPRNSITTLLQSSDGYLWCGTESGLVRFDGTLFKVFNRWNTQGLKNDIITCLYEDKHHTLYIGTAAGLTLYSNGTWTTLTVPGGQPFNNIKAITAYNSSKLLIATEKGLLILENGILKPSALKLNDNTWQFFISAMKSLPSGNTWIGTSFNGIFRLSQQQINSFPLPNFKEIVISCFTENRNQLLYTGTDDGIYVSSPNSHGVPPKVLFKGTSIRAMEQDKDGIIWIGTEGNGLIRMKDEQSTTITTRDGLPDDYINAICFDTEKNLWLATYTSGLVRIKPAIISSITTSNGLPVNNITALLTDPQKKLWIGTDHKGIAILENNTITNTLTQANGLTGNNIRCMCIDNISNIWIGTQSGLNRISIRNNSFSIVRFSQTDGLSSPIITSIATDKNGVIWIGTPTGVNRYDNTRFTIFGQSSGFLVPYIRVLFFDSLGTLYAGTRDGLYYFDPKSQRFLTRFNSFDHDITAIQEDIHGNLWIAAAGSGLFRSPKNSDRYTTFTAGNSIPSDYITGITPDKEGNLWFSSLNGIFKLPGSRLNYTPGDSPSDSLSLVCYNESDGMPGNECTRYGQPPAAVSSQSLLYFATTRGIAVINPATPHPNIPAPPVIIEDVIADNISILSQELPALSSQIQAIEFYFTAVQFSSPNTIRIMYKLEGYDDHWREPVQGRNRMAYYLNLPPGKYTFRVVACGNSGNCNYPGVSYSFHIKSPFHKQPIFYAFIIILIIVIMASVLWYFKRTGEHVRVNMSELSTQDKDAPKEKYKTSALLPETVEQILPRLIVLMEKEKIYLEPDLTLKKLSERLHVHYNHLSQIINEHLETSFNDYINKYRIEEARKKLTDPKEARKNILEIAYDTGFYSKSVFNTAFKKFTGLTPTEYRKKNFFPHSDS